MSSKSDSEVTQLKERAIQLGALLLTKCFPEKIVEINELLDSPMFKEVQQEQGTPTLPSTRKVKGKAVREMFEAAKPIVHTLAANAKLVKMWVAYMIERSNFGGASILEEVQKEIEKIQSEAVGYFKQISKYSAGRKSVSVVAGFPDVEKCRKDISEILCQVRNVYSMLIDLANKDWSKLKDSHNAMDTA